MSAVLTADEVIAHLELKPHPEGGYFRETFRDEGGHKGRTAGRRCCSKSSTARRGTNNGSARIGIKATIRTRLCRRMLGGARAVWGP